MSKLNFDDLKVGLRLKPAKGRSSSNYWNLKHLKEIEVISFGSNSFRAKVISGYANGITKYNNNGYGMLGHSSYASEGDNNLMAFYKTDAFDLCKTVFSEDYVDYGPE